MICFACEEEYSNDLNVCPYCGFVADDDSEPYCPYSIDTICPLTEEECPYEDNFTECLNYKNIEQGDFDESGD